MNRLFHSYCTFWYNTRAVVGKQLAKHYSSMFHTCSMEEKKNWSKYLLPYSFWVWVILPHHNFLSFTLTKFFPIYHLFLSFVLPPVHLTLLSRLLTAFLCFSCLQCVLWVKIPQAFFAYCVSQKFQLSLNSFQSCKLMLCQKLFQFFFFFFLCEQSSIINYSGSYFYPQCVILHCFFANIHTSLQNNLRIASISSQFFFLRRKKKTFCFTFDKNI